MNVDGLSIAIVGALADGAVRTAIRRRIETVIGALCARASRVADTVNVDRTRAHTNADGRATRPHTESETEVAGVRTQTPGCKRIQ